MDRALLTRADLTDADLRGANLDHAAAFEATLSHAKLQGASLRFADLSEAALDHVSAKKADFTRSTVTGRIEGGDFTAGTFFEACLKGAYTLPPGTLPVDDEGVLTTEVCLAVFRDAYMRDAVLEGAHLKFVDFGGADFRDTDLSAATLVGSNFALADLRGATLSPHIKQFNDLAQVRLSNDDDWPPEPSPR